MADVRRGRYKVPRSSPGVQFCEYSGHFNMKFHRVGLFCLCVCVRYCSAAPPQPAAGNEWPLDIRPDGSYRFAYSTGDTGRHYHTASASPDNTVTGVFGYRDLETGRDLQTKYSAGKRGFRANGPHIARRMDLSQNKIPYHPPVSPDSPLYNPTYSTYHDPNEDPTYSFEFRTPTHSRKEDSDYKGDVNGRYSYVDDVGLRHVVEYEAGSKIGFHVKTPFPESNPLGAGVFFAGPPANRKSSKPLRGHTAIQRGKDGSYSFTAVGPDQRRTEQSDATGNVKGFYTYLDDKGVQRTTQYIAGPNIGYKIVSSHTNDRYPVLPYPPPYPPFLPAGEDKDGGDIFGTGPDVTGTGSKPQAGSGQKPTGDGSKDPWLGAGPTGSTSTTATPIPGTEDDLFGPPTEGGATDNDNDEDYPTDHGYGYDVPGKDDGSFLQSSSSTSNIPYGNCCKLAPNRPAHRSKSQSRPSRNHEQLVGFPSGVPIRAHVQSLDLKTFGSRLPDPGAAIDLQVPPKSRRGGESDKPDYWGIKVRRHSRVGDQEEIQDTPNIQIAPHSLRQRNPVVRQTDTLNVRSAIHSEMSGKAETVQLEENQETHQRTSSHSVHGNAGIVQSEKNQDTRNLPTSSNSEMHGNAGTKQSDENRNIQNLQTSSHLEVHGNAGVVQPEENQDISNLKISRSERHLKLPRHLEARQKEETQDKDNHEAYSRSVRHLKEYENSGTGESEENEGTQSSQTFSDSSRSSQAVDPKENQDIEILQISTESTIHSELYRNIQAGEPKENQIIHIREPDENQEIHILETTSESLRHSEVHRRSVGEQSEKNKDSQKQRLGLKKY